jgi:hypothetical protein
MTAITVDSHIHNAQLNRAPFAYVQAIEERPRNFYVNYSTASADKIWVDFETDSASSLIVRKYSKDYAHLFEKAPWVRNFLQNASYLNDVKSLLPYYAEINNLIAHRQFDICNDFLSYVRVEELSDILLVGLLRLTSSWKNELSYWTTLFDNAKQELVNRGHDSNLLLKGLG